MITLILCFGITISTNGQCPIVCQISHTDTDCSSTTGDISIDITTGVPTFYVTVIHSGSNTTVYNYTGTNASHTVSGLSSGLYDITVDNIQCDPVFSQVEIEEYNHNWPILPYNDMRALAVDVEVDKNADVVAAGYWSGVINFTPPYNNSGNDMNSNGMTDVYLVKYDHCGELQWQQQIFTTGQEEMGCKVNAIAFDQGNNIVACGTFSDGDVVFPGPLAIALPLDPNNPSAAWVAKFERGTGYCQWAMRINSSHELYAKDVCVYQNGEIFVFCDFKGDVASIYDASGPITPETLTNSSAGTFDAFLLALDEDGLFLEMFLVGNTANDDYAGGLCCFPSTQSSSIPEIILTGSTNGSFLGQRWYYDAGNNPSLIFKTTFNLFSSGLPINSGKYGLTTEALQDPSTYYWSFVFAGYANSTGGGTFPFLASSYTGPGTPPATQMTNNYLGFIGNNATRLNLANALTINANTGELFMGGIVNNSGDHPYNTLIYENIPATAYGDFFVDKFPIASGGIGSIDYPVYSNGGTANYSQYPLTVPGYIGLGSDQKGRTFVTGSYLDELATNYGLTIPSTGVSGVYIARLCEDANGPVFKNRLLGTSLKKDSDYFVHSIPNPATFYLNIQSNIKDGTLEIRTIDGRIITEFSMKLNGEGSITVNISNLVPGLYFLRASNAQTSRTSKIMITR